MSSPRDGPTSPAPAWRSRSPEPRTPHAPPRASQVSAVEFRLTLSRTTIRAGAAVVELVNYGEDDHDLLLRRTGSRAPALRIRTVPPGAARSREARLRPGRYALWCSLGDHRARGMTARLVVRAR